MRHAWLIIAHNEFTVLQRLVSMLDDARSDFYIHFDRKVRQVPEIEVQKGRLFVLKERVDVRWGTVSQIRTELLLLETAQKNGPYAHYHIISGTHLPLKPVNGLFKFYDSHQGEEIMRFWKRDDGDADFKMRRYHFPIANIKSPGESFAKRVENILWRANLKVQKTFGIRHLVGEEFHKTDNWKSLTERACRYLVEKKKAILKKYCWSLCGDEYFAATELSLSENRFTLMDCQNLLHVEFLGDTPKKYPLSDYTALQETGRLWARKFTSHNTL